MKLTRAGYNILVIIWLIPMVIVDFISNTVLTGDESDIYYYKTMADGLLLCYAIFQAFFRADTASVAVAQRRESDRGDVVTGFEPLGKAEYLYCLILVVYGAVNWWAMHNINRNSTGALSAVSLLWSFVSIAVVVLSAVQFYHLKSGAIVQLKKRIVA